MKDIKRNIHKIIFWLNCARVYSLPITILSWLVAFIYSLKHQGSILAGIICLIGISLVHMATNLIDDYFDYKILTKDEKYMNSAQNCKCAYLKNKQASIKDLRNAIIIFLALAAITGGILFFMSGPYVILLAIIALIIAFIYQRLSIIGLGEFAVIIAYGPLMFEGIYYVMTKTFSKEIFILSFACALFTNTILYAHMLMDFDGDECSHKITLCRKLKTKNNALNFILVFYISSYILVGVIAQRTHNEWFFLTFLTIPLILDLYNSLKQYNKEKTKLPHIYPWHYPLDNWEKIKNTPEASFYFRFFYSRNIVTLFMLLACIAILIG